MPAPSLTQAANTGMPEISGIEIPSIPVNQDSWLLVSDFLEPSETVQQTRSAFA